MPALLDPVATVHCPACEILLPPGSPAGHCPRCLVRLTLATSIDPVTAEELESLPWTTLGDCELYEEIARGGMGVIYRAQQRSLRRTVAVKVLLHSSFASKAERERFRREAEAAARLRHPGIVTIHTIGEEEGVPWFSMELVEGSNLEQRVKEQPMPAREAASCLHDLCLAVQHAHEQGVLHRDLKPSNVLLDAAGKPHITDFGIALCINMETSGSTSRLTHTGQTLGSPGYAAPEQALHGAADARTDVYGLGAILYQVLTGRPPFQGPTLDALLLQLRESDPVPPRRLNPTVPSDLETICLCCLSKAPASRYATAQALADDLQRFLDGRPIKARPVSTPEHVWRWCRRNPGMASLGVTTLSLLVALVLGSLWFASQQAALERRSTLISEARALRVQGQAGSRARALAALEEAWRIRPSSEIRHEVIARLVQPELKHERVFPAGALHPPDAQTSSDGKTHVRLQGDTLIVSATADGHELARLSGHAGDTHLKLDDAATRLAFCSKGKKQTLQVISLPEGRLLHILQHPSGITCLDWSGELLATGGSDRFTYVWDVESGVLRHRVAGHEAPLEAVAFRPGGQELMTLAQDNFIRLWHAALGVEIIHADMVPAHVAPCWWSADGEKFYATIKVNSLVDVYQVEGLETLHCLAPAQQEPRTQNLATLSVSPDGKLAAGVTEKTARVWDLEHGRQLANWPKRSDEWLGVVFSRTDHKLWRCGYNSKLLWQDFRTVPFSTGEFPVPPGSLLAAVSPSGQSFALLHGAFNQVMIHQPGGGLKLFLPQRDPLAVVFSPDGRWVFTSSFSQAGGTLWEIPSGKKIRHWETQGIVLDAAFTREGSTLFLRGERNLMRISTTDWTEQVHPLGKDKLNGLALSPDGHFMACYQRGDILLLKQADLQEVARISLPSYLGWLGNAELDFDGPGNTLALHTALGGIVICDLQALRRELQSCGMDW